MLAFYLLALKMWLRDFALYAIFSIVGVLLLDRLGFGVETTMALVYLSTVAAPLISGALLARNLNWLLALPVSKGRVLFFGFAVQWTLFLLTAAYCLIVQYGVSAVKKGSLPLMPDQLPSFEGIFSTSSAFMTVVLVVCGANLLFFSLYKGGGMPGTFTYRVQHDLRWRVGAILLGAVLLLFRSQLDGAFAMFSIFTVLFCVLSFDATAASLAMGHRPRRKFLAAGLGFALFQIALVYGVAARGMGSGTAATLADSVVFLGPFAGDFREERLAPILASKIPEATIDEVGAVYLRKFSDGKPLRGDSPLSLRFSAAIGAKEDLSSLKATLRLFDLATLGADDLFALFDKLERLGGNGHSVSAALPQLLRIPLSSAQLAALLASNGKDAQLHALVHARYARAPELAAALSARIGGLADPQKIEALTSLSLLVGRRLTLDDYGLVKQGRGPASVTPREQHACGRFKGVLPGSLVTSDEAELNVCLRSASEAKGFAGAEKIESLGWWTRADFAKSRLARELLGFQKAR